MGCFQSKEAKRAAAYKLGEVESPKGKGDIDDGQPKYSWERKRADPKDFMFDGLKGETACKGPGSINGQGFVMQNCEDCDLFLLDYVDSVQIDECKNCRIFIGPTEASIFIRDCVDCKCFFICRQYRTRDCKDCVTLLSCATRPVIESSKNMRMGCFDGHYEGIDQHLAAAQMTEFQNFWSHIFDFTPGKNNWSFLPPEITVASLLQNVPDDPVFAGVKELENPPVMLRTWGERPPPSSEQCLVLFPPRHSDEAREFISRAVGAGATLLRTNEVKLDEAMATSVLSKAGKSDSATVKAFSRPGKAVISLQFCGDGSTAQIEALAKASGDAIFTANADAASEMAYAGIDGGTTFAA
mmetsp:Transcript_26594/g.87178  ORF Transcript_26594/g.87178 Transcript_26594/m.87178 type:complete len:355 (+) Transcript_26594:38-1102(+)